MKSSLGVSVYLAARLLGITQSVCGALLHGSLHEVLM